MSGLRFKEHDAYETLGQFKQIEGRRHTKQQVTVARLDRITPVHTEPFDFLKGGQGPDVLVGRPTEKSTKYHNGFQRKPHATILPEASRLDREDFMAERHYAREGAREDYLGKNGCRYGNVFQRMDGQQQIPRNRKHYPSTSNEPAMRRRQQQGGARYFTETNPELTQRRVTRMENVTNRQQQQSSVLGVGRGDLQSKGVWDNFTGPPEGLLQPLNTAERRERPF